MHFYNHERKLAFELNKHSTGYPQDVDAKLLQLSYNEEKEHDGCR